MERRSDNGVKRDRTVDEVVVVTRGDTLGEALVA